MLTKKLSTISAVCEVFEKRAFSALDLTKKAQSGQFGFMPEYNESPQIVRIQTKLKEQGFDPGTVDGKLGPKTFTAMKAWAEKNGLDLTALPELVDYNTEVKVQHKNTAVWRQLNDLVQDTTNPEAAKAKAIALIRTTDSGDIADKLQSGELAWGPEVLKLLAPTFNYAGKSDRFDQTNKVMEFLRQMDSKTERAVPGPTTTASTHLNEMLKLADHFAKKL